MAILDINDLSISFGGLKAVDGFRLTIGENELVGLIGPNGAGKTTVFNLLTGVYKPSGGTITLSGTDVSKLKPSDIVLLGSSRTFQNIRLFKNMTVLDNIRVAYHHRMRYSLLEGVFKTKRFRKEERESHEVAHALLDVFNMDAYAHDLARNLPYGKQRKLEIARALATGPKLLLLDEPAAGMNPLETEELMETIRLIKDTFKVSILLIEHDMRLVMGICERIVVLDYGKIIATGMPDEIKKHPDVIRAYLGG
jgi:branched-chain amino acid transport system ATP-binding protein